MLGIWVPSDPHLYRWMMFVDGENLVIRAQKFAENEGIDLLEGPYYKPDVFVWIPGIEGTQRALEEAGKAPRLRSQAIRSYYYTSTTGGEDVVKSVRQRLWNRSFQPEVFRKSRGRSSSKGVDVALAKDFLSNAFRDNYDVAILVAGDGDYVPLVEK